MSDDKKTTAKKAPEAPPASTSTEPPVVVGKQWRGQRHSPITTPEQLAARADEQKKYNKPGAIGIRAYFAIKGVRDPVMIAGMEAYTHVRNATVEDWDTIFANY